MSIAGSQIKELSFLRHSHLPVLSPRNGFFREHLCTNEHLCALINSKITTVVKSHLILRIRKTHYISILAHRMWLTSLKCQAYRHRFYLKNVEILLFFVDWVSDIVFSHQEKDKLICFLNGHTNNIVTVYQRAFKGIISFCHNNHQSGSYSKYGNSSFSDKKTELRKVIIGEGGGGMG